MAWPFRLWWPDGAVIRGIGALPCQSWTVHGGPASGRRAGAFGVWPPRLRGLAVVSPLVMATCTPPRTVYRATLRADLVVVRSRYLDRSNYGAVSVRSSCPSRLPVTPRSRRHASDRAGSAGTVPEPGWRVRHSIAFPRPETATSTRRGGIRRTGRGRW